MEKEILWVDCPKELKDEVKEIQRKQKELKEQFLKGLITGRRYRYNITLLMKKVDEVEKKYA